MFREKRDTKRDTIMENYKFYLHSPFEKRPEVISKLRKEKKVPIMVLDKNTNQREPKYYSARESIVKLSVRIGNKQIQIYTPLRIHASDWNFETKQPKPGRAPGLMHEMNVIQKRVEDLFSELRINKNRLPTVEEIRSRAAMDKDSGFFSIFDEFLQQYKGQGIVKSYKQTRDKIFAMNKSIEFNDIDLTFYDRFVKDLEKQELNQNTQGRHIKNLKLFMKWSRMRHHHKNREYQDFKLRSEAVGKFFFNIGELESIINHDFEENSKLDRVRDFFIISAFTGLRYEDYTRLNLNHVSTQTLRIISAKNNIQLSAQVLPEVRFIFDKWLRITSGARIIPPKISNVKMNAYLKEMAREIDDIKNINVSVKKGKNEIWFKKADHITTHTGRRSFCSNMHYLKIPSKVIMKASGHLTMSSFEKYILDDDQGYYSESAGILETYNTFKESRKLRIV